jgi:sucrose-phosphate synthase
MILALARPDPRKNLRRLVEAYAASPTLREHANLVIVPGNRDDIEQMPDETRAELTGLLLDIDRHDLWGSVAMPKHHAATDVPDLYRIAARSRGVFVNPALTEPFGLTLIEAAASGLPIVATDDGGPRDIIANCNNGFLIDAVDPANIAKQIEHVLADRRAWRSMAEAGRAGVQRHYTWAAHVNRYIKEITRMIDDLHPRGLPRKTSEASSTSTACWCATSTTPWWGATPTPCAAWRN